MTLIECLLKYEYMKQVRKEDLSIIETVVNMIFFTLSVSDYSIQDIYKNFGSLTIVGVCGDHIQIQRYDRNENAPMIRVCWNSIVLFHFLPLVKQVSDFTMLDWKEVSLTHYSFTSILFNKIQS